MPPHWFAVSWRMKWKPQFCMVSRDYFKSNFFQLLLADSGEVLQILSKQTNSWDYYLTANQEHWQSNHFTTFSRFSLCPKWELNGERMKGRGITTAPTALLISSGPSHLQHFHSPFCWWSHNRYTWESAIAVYGPSLCQSARRSPFLNIFPNLRVLNVALKDAHHEENENQHFRTGVIYVTPPLIHLL